MPHRPADVVPPPITHVIEVAKLSREAASPFAITLDVQALPGIAQYLGVLSLEDVHFAGELAAFGAAGWQATGQLQAVVEQGCVVTLAPVTQRIDQPVLRRYVPAAEIAEEIEVVVTEEDDSPDPFDNTIDLGALLLEEIALALDPYPRAEGAALKTHIFAAPGVKPMTDEDARPFAKLAALKDKLQGPG